ncbi:MAG: hypothetical protein ACJ8AH_14380 [Stellaceae bacterium]
MIVAGKVRKWEGQLLDVDLPHLRRQLEASRDYVFVAAGIEQDLFPATDRACRMSPEFCLAARVFCVKTGQSPHGQASREQDADFL